MTLMMELKQQRREGREEGERKTELASIRNLMESVGWTAQQAMDALKIPVEKREAYFTQL